MVHQRIEYLLSMDTCVFGTVSVAEQTIFSKKEPWDPASEAKCDV